jgi:hypothetical protein
LSEKKLQFREAGNFCPIFLHFAQITKKMKIRKSKKVSVFASYNPSPNLNQ